MSKIEYVSKSFKPATLAIIEKASEIIEEYQADGLNLTLRQLYYQFVSRALIDNKQSEYKRLGDIVSNARLAGLIDWTAIEDRTRNVVQWRHDTDPGITIHRALRQFNLDKWAGQEYRPEVWIEKEALTGVIERVCGELDVPYFACRGYVSQSEMWGAAQRLRSYLADGQTPVIIHLGDHDPSGVDMTRDVLDRLDLFSADCKVERIALNYDQVEQYTPPPNPVKFTDSRSDGYEEKYGASCWELDALEPRVIVTLIKDTIEQYTDEGALAEIEKTESEYIDILQRVADNWETL